MSFVAIVKNLYLSPLTKLCSGLVLLRVNVAGAILSASKIATRVNEESRLPPSLKSLYELMIAPPFCKLGLILRTTLVLLAESIVGAIGALGTVAVWINPIGLQPLHPITL